MKRRGVETRIIIAAGHDMPRKVDQALLKAVARSRAWFEELASGRVRSLANIAAAREYHTPLRRASLAPGVHCARNRATICQGRQTAELSAETLLNRIDLPLEWSAQLGALGID